MYFVRLVALEASQHPSCLALKECFCRRIVISDDAFDEYFFVVFLKNSFTIIKALSASIDLEEPSWFSGHKCGGASSPSSLLIAQVLHFLLAIRAAIIFLHKHRYHCSECCCCDTNAPSFPAFQLHARLLRLLFRGLWQNTPGVRI